MKYKFLSAAAFAAMQAKADKMDALVAAFNASAPEGTEMNAESIAEMLAGDTHKTELAALQAQLQEKETAIAAAEVARVSLQTTVDAQVTSIADLTAQVEALQNNPAAVPAAAVATQEATAGTETDAIKAKLNGKEGDALLTELRSMGLIK